MECNNSSEIKNRLEIEKLRQQKLGAKKTAPIIVRLDKMIKAVDDIPKLKELTKEYKDQTEKSPSDSLVIDKHSRVKKLPVSHNGEIYTVDMETNEVDNELNTGDIGIVMSKAVRLHSQMWGKNKQEIKEIVDNQDSTINEYVARGMRRLVSDKKGKVRQQYKEIIKESGANIKECNGM